MTAVRKNKIFARGSLRYYISNLGFPSKYRDRVANAYNFFRKLDDIVDSVDPSADELNRFLDKYHLALKGSNTDDEIINEFVATMRRCKIDAEWIESMFKSMKADLNGAVYTTLDDTLDYVYGVAEVVGLTMCRILDLEDSAFPYAGLLGRSAQWINMIRDLAEDLELGRSYFPAEDLEKFNLDSLDYQNALDKKENFIRFIHFQCDRFDKWVEEGTVGYKYIPTNLLNPIKIATHLDKWKANEIRKDPLALYKGKINPSPAKITSTFLLFTFCKRTARIG